MLAMPTEITVITGAANMSAMSAIWLVRTRKNPTRLSGVT